MTAAEKGIIPSFDQLAMLLLIHPGILLALFASRTFSCCLPKPHQEGTPWPDTDQSVVLLPRGTPLGVWAGISVDLNGTGLLLPPSSSLFRCLWVAVLI